MCSENSYPTMGRRDFLKVGAAGLAGAVLLGGAGGKVLAQTGSSLQSEMESAAKEYEVPKELLLAMGYVNTMWEMPPPGISEYDLGQLHGRGEYGIMQLAQNPERNTLGKAAELTGLSEEELKTDRESNILGGAALLADLRDGGETSDLGGWQEALTSYSDADLYPGEVYEVLNNGASLTNSTGEKLLLPAQDVEEPAIFEAMGSGEYRRSYTRPAHRSNFTYSRRPRSYRIRRIVVHVAEGSFSGTVGWFKNPSANVSAHYVVGRNGRIAQCVRHKNIAWHAGKWKTNRHSIGIEHAGYGRYRSTWTKAMYRSSAKLSAYVCKRYGIPVNRHTIVPHRRIVSTACPGRHFNIKRYRKLVRRYKRRM